jgi:drug/metabolite transporter (DMT)-like permease
MQTEMMVVGMSMCFLAHLLLHRKTDDHALNVHAKPTAPILICIIPLLMDLFASSLELISLNYVAGSVYSIANCLIVVSTAFFSRIILRTVFNRHQILGCALTVLGVVVAGVGESLADDSDEEQVRWV